LQYFGKRKKGESLLKDEGKFVSNIDVYNRQLACYQSIMGKMVTFTCARNGRSGASILHVRNIVYF
jgi:hypothetical protein